MMTEEQYYQIAEACPNALERGWEIRDRVVNTGKLHLGAHTAIWESAQVGDTLKAMITR